MNPQCDIAIGDSYNNESQRARVITENWMTTNGYCLSCENDRLTPTPRNTQARDFECEVCSHPYELKSTRGLFGKRLVDGAYSAMMNRIESGKTPSFFLLEYNSEWNVTNLKVVHHSLITPDVIQQRNPLSLNAKRKGWIGCNILLSQIPIEGRIDIIQDGFIVPKTISREKFLTSENLSMLSLPERTWASNTLKLLHSLMKTEFTLNEAYSFEEALQARYPQNHNIRAKIRQQLQVLRDAGILTFVSAGKYRFNFS